MKKRIILAAIGVSFVLAACSGQPEASESLTPTQEVETTTEQTSEENETQEETVSEQETATEQETAAEQESGEQETAVEEEETEASQDAEQAKGEFTQGDIAVSVRGTAVTPGENMEKYVGALGEPDALDGVPSCVEEGDDKVYTYGGVVIYTYRANGTDQINLIEITGTESLVKGIHIGDSKDTVIAAYGDSYTMDGAEMLYESNDKVMGLVLTDGKVSFIELFAR